MSVRKASLVLLMLACMQSRRTGGCSSSGGERVQHSSLEVEGAAQLSGGGGCSTALDEVEGAAQLSGWGGGCSTALWRRWRVQHSSLEEVEGAAQLSG